MISIENFPKDPSPSGNVPCIHGQSQGSAPLLKHHRPFKQPGLLLLRIIHNLHRRLGYRHGLPGQTGLIDIYLSLNQYTVAGYEAIGLEDISGDQLHTLYLLPVAIPYHRDYGGMLGQLLDLQVARPQEKVVDYGCEQGNRY